MTISESLVILKGTVPRNNWDHQRFSLTRIYLKGVLIETKWVCRDVQNFEMTLGGFFVLDNNTFWEQIIVE